MTKLTVFDGFSWLIPKAISVKDAGAWKPAKTVYVKDAGVWKPVWTAPGSQLFTASGTFTVPAGVWSICIAALSAGTDGTSGGAANWDGFGSPGSGGNGGDGGSLAWANNIAVTPGQTFSVTVGTGSPSYAGTRQVALGRGGFSGSWDVQYLGGQGGAGQFHLSGGSNGYPGGGGGSPATWGGAGTDGQAGPGGTTLPAGGNGMDELGLTGALAAALAGNGTLSGGYSVRAAPGNSYGGGGGGGIGQDTTAFGGAGLGPMAGGLGVGGFVRFIWGAKSFPSNANF